MPKNILAAMVMDMVKKFTEGPHEAQEVLINVSAFIAAACDMDEEQLKTNYANILKQMREEHESHDDSTCPNCTDKDEKPTTRDSDVLFN